MSALPAEYYRHELKKLLGDYKPKAEMPCWRCNTPEGAEIVWGVAQMVGAMMEQHKLPAGVATPTLDAIASDLEPVPKSDSEPVPGSAKPLSQMSDADWDAMLAAEGWTAEDEEAWHWDNASQLWLPLPYPPSFLPARCCARRPRLTLVVSAI